MEVHKYIQTNKKNGFTLLEMLVVISMIIILSSFTTVGIKDYRNFMNDMEAKYTENAILSFVVNSKLHSIKSDCEGCIIYFDSEKKLKYIIGSNQIDCLSLPDGFYLSTIITHEGTNRIYIKKDGFTDDACTIELNDMFGKQYDLTICVGTADVEIK